jgi:hypothetical protein
MVPGGQTQIAHAAFGWVRREPDGEPGKRIVSRIDFDAQHGTRIQVIPNLTRSRSQPSEGRTNNGECQTARSELILRERLVDFVPGVGDDRIVQDVNHGFRLESVLVNGCARVAREKVG